MIVKLFASLSFSLLIATSLEAQTFTQKGLLDDLLLPRKDLTLSLLGINAFGNDSRFGPIRSQFKEVNSTLGIKHMRLLFAWNDQVQPTPKSNPFFGFYDELTNSIPTGSDAIVVLTGIPSWMKDSKNWIDNDPRHTFVEKWVNPVVSRYKSKTKIIGWQIWNEPDMLSNPDNTTLEIANSPTNYVEMVADASGLIKQISPRQRTINGATTSINQNYPETLQYNKDLISAGILDYVNVFAIHYYSKQPERVIVPGGIADALKNVSKPIWVTESGEKGVLKQADYARRVFPFLFKQIPAIKRIYIYQFTDSSQPNTTYGLRTLSAKNPISDLYVYLRNKVQTAVKRK